MVTANRPVSIGEIITSLKSTFSLDASETEISDSLTTKRDRYDSQIQNREVLYFLKPSALQNLEESKNRYGLDKIVEDFVASESPLFSGSIPDVISRFMYRILESSVSSLSHIVSESKNLKLADEINHFSSEEKKLVNDFIEWSNRNKNIALFELIGFALDYAILSQDPKAISGIANTIAAKSIYIDTNIIFRAIGLNGESRRKRALELLKKCTSIGQKIKIFGDTYTEFRASISHHANQIRRAQWGAIYPDILEEYNLNEDIFTSYINWKHISGSPDVDLFVASIEAKYDQLKKEFSIEEDWRTKEKVSESITQDQVLLTASAIARFKNENIDNSHEYDAKHYYMMEYCSKAAKGFSECAFFFVSADQKFIAWVSGNCKHISWALMPSHWLSFILRFHSRTDDDYAAFSSFLKFPVERSEYDEIAVITAASGIASITGEHLKQKEILRAYISEKFKNLSSPPSRTETFEDAADYARVKLGIQLEQASTLNKEFQDEIARREQEKQEARRTHLREILNSKHIHLESLIQLRAELEHKESQYDRIQQRIIAMDKRMRIELIIAYLLIPIVWLELGQPVGIVAMIIGLLLASISMWKKQEVKLHHIPAAIIIWATKTYNTESMSINYDPELHQRTKRDITGVECDIKSLEAERQAILIN